MQPKKIWLSSPHMSGREMNYVQEAFDTNWIAPLGPNVERFEQSLTNYVGVPAAALSSGTAALHLALVLLGVQPGDCVICQSFTFAASANPITYLGATPVFIDSEPDTWNMDPNALEDALKYYAAKGKRPKAIIPVHLYGMPAKMDEIMTIAHAYGVPVVEDAAEALGSAYEGQPCGALGQMAVLSFNGNKIITTSGGGALLAADKQLVERARFLATQARDAAPHYQHSQVGYNYRLSNVLAGIGCGQMEVLDERVAQRRSVFQHYYNRYSQSGCVTFQPEPSNCSSNRWLTAVLLNDQQDGISPAHIQSRLAAAHIESRPLWKPLHLQPVFAGAPYFGGNTCAHLFETGLCLPSGSNMTDEDLQRITDVLDSVLLPVETGVPEAGLSVV